MCGESFFDFVRERERKKERERERKRMSKHTIDTSDILKGAKGLNHVNVSSAKASSKSDPDEKESLSQLGIFVDFFFSLRS